MITQAIYMHVNFIETPYKQISNFLCLAFESMSTFESLNIHLETFSNLSVNSLLTESLLNEEAIVLLMRIADHST